MFLHSDPSLVRSVFLVGRDAIAVEAVGADFVGMTPVEIPIIQEAMARGLGEGDFHKIKVLGDPIEQLKEKLQ